MTRPMLVLLHGWGSDSRIWDPVIAPLREVVELKSLDLPGFGSAPMLPQYSLDAVLDALLNQLPPVSVPVGWSLGGMLAIQLAARFPERVSGVITLATNAKFVATPDYSTAMPAAINQQFNHQVARDPVSALKLFCGLLAQGDLHERALLKMLRQQMSASFNENWLDALELLAHLDNREFFARLRQPGLHLLGEKDALVPVVALDSLRQLNPEQELIVLPGVAHAIHWSQPQYVIEQIVRFLYKHSWVSSGALEESASPDQTQIDKKKIAQSFSRAAGTYDHVAGLQRRVSQHLLAKTKLCSADIVLDVGSGTGAIAAHMASQVACVIAVDIAEGMLRFAKDHYSHPITWVCGDAESLPFESESVDVIFSSLAIQWCNNLPVLMAELHRVLKPGGNIYLSTLGPNTLHELKAAWRQVDDYVHVNHFATEEELKEACAKARLTLDVIEREEHLLHFESLGDLTHSLKALGAHNMNPGQPAGLMGRQHLRLFKAAYETLRTGEGLPLTYDVIYLVARKSTIAETKEPTA